MLDPTFKTGRSFATKQRTRTGAIMPLFALLLPLLLIFAGFAINLAYMQLVSTELKVATDSAAHAGGRAMSLLQNDDPEASIQLAVNQAKLTAQANLVGGRALSVGTGDDSEVSLKFGRSIRANNGTGLYEFTEIDLAQITSGSERPSSIGVTGNVSLPTIFRMLSFNPSLSTLGNGNVGTGSSGSAGGDLIVAGLNTFNPVRKSIATQVDRDIALVLDRSGSMRSYRDQALLNSTLEDIYNSPDEIAEPGYYEYYFWEWSGGWQARGYHRWEDRESNWVVFNIPNYWRYIPEVTTTEQRITFSEYQDAIKGVNSREYTNNVIYQLERWLNENHTLGSSYSSSENSKLTSEMAKYAHDWEYETHRAPRFSRWYFLALGVDAFFDVLDVTDQQELVSLVTFNSNASLQFELQENYDGIRSQVDGIRPSGGTAIGRGITTGFPSIVSGPAARAFAAKTIVVLTDGENTTGQDPVEAVKDVLEQHLVTVHTVTFSVGADQDAMAAVAAEGQGRPYHADDGSALVQIFEEIANNLPTILTQ